MKKSEIATIATFSLLSVGAAYLLASTLIGQPSAATVKVKTVEEISSTVKQPDPTVFNSDAINPTVEVIIGAK